MHSNSWGRCRISLANRPAETPNLEFRRHGSYLSSLAKDLHGLTRIPKPQRGRKRLDSIFTCARELSVTRSHNSTMDSASDACMSGLTKLIRARKRVLSATNRASNKELTEKPSTC